MKKNVHFAALFPGNLALITHNTPLSVNPSICDFEFEHTNSIGKRLYIPSDYVYSEYI